MSIDYTYNENGIRTSKTVNNVRTDYYLNGSQVLAEITNGDRIDYRYEGNGQLIALRWNGTEYYTVTNIQGDILGLIDGNGNSVVQYTYDAWGNQTSCTGTLANTLGEANPYRYRGYRFDEETGLYYLQSRYYDAAVGRFINADDANIMLEPEYKIFTMNFFQYCYNNPIKYVDYFGFTPNGSEDSGFYDPLKNLFYWGRNAPQKYLGYCDFYDYVVDVTSTIFFDLEWLTIKFKYGQFEWRIEFWKGTYGKIPYYRNGSWHLADASTGCEIGIYNRPANWRLKNIFGVPIIGYRKYNLYSNDLYDCATKYSMYMKMSLYNSNGNLIFSRNDWTWWLTGFIPFLASDPKYLKMKVYIEFPEKAMREAFEKKLRSTPDSNYHYPSYIYLSTRYRDAELYYGIAFTWKCK